MATEPTQHSPKVKDMADEPSIKQGDKVRHMQTGQTGTASNDSDATGSVQVAMDSGITVNQAVHDLEKAKA